MQREIGEKPAAPFLCNFKVFVMSERFFFIYLFFLNATCCCTGNLGVIETFPYCGALTLYPHQQSHAVH